MKTQKNVYEWDLSDEEDSRADREVEEEGVGGGDAPAQLHHGQRVYLAAGVTNQSDQFGKAKVIAVVSAAMAVGEQSSPVTKFNIK